MVSLLKSYAYLGGSGEALCIRIVGEGTVKWCVEIPERNFFRWAMRADIRFWSVSIWFLCSSIWISILTLSCVVFCIKCCSSSLKIDIRSSKWFLIAATHLWSLNSTNAHSKWQSEHLTFRKGHFSIWSFRLHFNTDSPHDLFGQRTSPYWQTCWWLDKRKSCISSKQPLLWLPHRTVRENSLSLHTLWSGRSPACPTVCLQVGQVAWLLSQVVMQTLQKACWQLCVSSGSSITSEQIVHKQSLGVPSTNRFGSIPIVKIYALLWLCWGESK